MTTKEKDTSTEAPIKHEPKTIEQAQKQLDIIKRGALEVIPETELLKNSKIP
ncbi:MAG: hypothetical protein R3A80_12430 [Bdellovibrionota bacterium]